MKVPTERAAPQPPVTLQQLLALSASQQAACDIGRMNLLCAVGLRGSDGLDVAPSLARLDGLARKVEWETSRHLYHFRNQPDDFKRSEAYFRMLMMATVLQQDLGVGYNPDRMSEPGVFEPNDAFFANSQDVFLHGLIGPRRMGTCSSLPVLYVAVGRRLGYPLKLVTAKCHLFVRWEDERSRLNVEATGIGFNSFEDDHYRRWPLPVSDREIEAFGYLQSLNATQELALFLSLRGHCLMSMGRAEEAVAAHAEALRLAPESHVHQVILAAAQKEAAMRSRPRLGLPLDPAVQVRLLMGMDSIVQEMEIAAAHAEFQSRRGEAEEARLLSPLQIPRPPSPGRPFYSLFNNSTQQPERKR